MCEFRLPLRQFIDQIVIVLPPSPVEDERRGPREAGKRGVCGAIDCGDLLLGHSVRTPGA